MDSFPARADGPGSVDGVAHPPVDAPAGAPSPSDAAPGAVPPMPVLAVSGLVVTKAALLAVLRRYAPQVVDIVPLDGQRFVLELVPAGQ